MIFYFLIIGIGLIIAARLIINELQKERLGGALPISNEIPDQQQPASVVNNRLSVFENDGLFSLSTFRAESLPAENVRKPLDLSLTKLELLLNEKNAEINRIKMLLQVEQKNKIEYEKIKDLLQRQIFESRQMNREIQRELKLLQAHAEAIDEQSHKLKAELVYKDQLLLKKDYQLTELNIALQGHILPQTSEYLSKKPSSDNDSDWDRGLEWRNKK